MCSSLLCRFFQGVAGESLTDNDQVSCMPYIDNLLKAPCVWNITIAVLPQPSYSMPFDHHRTPIDIGILMFRSKLYKIYIIAALTTSTTWSNQ